MAFATPAFVPIWHGIDVSGSCWSGANARDAVGTMLKDNTTFQGLSARWATQTPAIIPEPFAHAKSSASKAKPTRARRVLCITPLGYDGRGGIDRLYRYVRELPPERDDLDIRYMVSRGATPGNRWPLVFPWHLARIVGALLVWRPDLLHINYANGGSLVRKVIIVAVARLLGIPMLMHLHCVFPVEGARRKTLAGRAALFLARSAAHVVAIGHKAERDFIDVAGLHPARVHVIPNGAPDLGSAVSIPKRHETVDILFAGELGPRKGPTFLIEALARLKADDGWRCTIAGNGDVAGCRRLIEELGLASRIQVAGWLPAAQIHDLMRAADVVVLPSAREVMPMCLVEATAAGAALLATPVGETKDVIVSGENGFLIERDPEIIATRLRQLISDRDLLARMQIASRESYVRKFRLDLFVDCLSHLYTQIT